jgi:AraC-like DNA-binding protein
MSQFKPTTVNKILNIDTIYTIHYMEFSRDFVFIGETHDFWEFQYCDKGEIEVMADKTGLVLHQGEIIFHQPNEFHNIWANGRIAPNLMVISFKCDSVIMQSLKGHVFKLSKKLVIILSDIFEEAKKVYAPPFGDPYTTSIEILPNPNRISEQLFKNFLEIFLLKLFENQAADLYRAIESSYIQYQYTPENLAEEIINFLQFNIYNSITLDDISTRFSISKAWLAHNFKSFIGKSIIDYFISLKIDEAKKMIREKKLNITQISEKMGYSSIHYFSRQFKMMTGMAPREYAKSIIAKGYGCRS